MVKILFPQMIQKGNTEHTYVTDLSLRFSKFYIYELLYNSNTVLYQFLETVTSNKTHFSSWSRTMKVLSDVPLSRKLYKTVLKLYESSYIKNLENLKLKSRDQNYHQWQSCILVTCLRLYHVTTLLHCHWWNFWSRNTDE